ncbi:hypothetical protein HNR46_001618 [Haloferula luteola]|uniref:Uncharacterized protein n=2 Tax=Haloferula luteola TaxID=595692 RepID=A0A840V040_9BACT|nr:hypothetical protein [Haloferula luteola]
MATICRFIGKRPKDSQQLLDCGLPVARIPGDRKHTPRVVPAAFFRWMADRAGGEVTEDDIRRDFEDFLKGGKA